MRPPSAPHARASSIDGVDFTSRDGSASSLLKMVMGNLSSSSSSSSESVAEGDEVS
jgi:hypothetical protein